MTNKHMTMYTLRRSFFFLCFYKFEFVSKPRTLPSLHMTGVQLRNALQWLANGESSTIVANRVVRYTFLNFYAISIV